MITRIVKMQINDFDVDAFKGTLESKKSNIQEYDGCVSVDILNDKHDKLRFFSYSIWESEEHLEAYRNSSFFKELWTSIKPFFKENAQAWTVENIL